MKTLLLKFDALVEKQCDITLDEIRTHFDKKIECSLQTISNSQSRLGWSYKKKSLRDKEQDRDHVRFKRWH